TGDRLCDPDRYRGGHHAAADRDRESRPTLPRPLSAAGLLGFDPGAASAVRDERSAGGAGGAKQPGGVGGAAAGRRDLAGGRISNFRPRRGGGGRPKEPDRQASVAARASKWAHGVHRGNARADALKRK